MTRLKYNQRTKIQLFQDHASKCLSVIVSLTIIYNLHKLAGISYPLLPTRRQEGGNLCRRNVEPAKEIRRFGAP
jgi:hypothetical protein